MPGLIRTFAEKTGKSVEEVERLWDKSKEIVKKEYPDINAKNFKFFELVTGVLKKMLKLK